MKTANEQEMIDKRLKGVEGDQNGKQVGKSERASKNKHVYLNALDLIWNHGLF